MGPFKRFDVKKADRVSREELSKIGIELRDTSQPVSTLSGGERQSGGHRPGRLLWCQGAYPG